VIRQATASDTPRLVELWRAAGLRFRPELAGRELGPLLARGLVLVAEDADGQLAGTVTGTFDGMRGWVRRLATRPDRRGRGIATALMAELERRMRAAGCPKINLLIEGDNSAVAGFYARVGYQRRDVMFMQKWMMQNEQGRVAADSAPGAVGWRDLTPELSEDAYVFAAAQQVPAAVAPFAAIREDEGLTLILTRADADQAGLRYDYVAARITLLAHSALADVGLTAVVSRTLADAGISCNVVAGLAHDHLFVDWAHGARALALLRGL